MLKLNKVVGVKMSKVIITADKLNNRKKRVKIIRALILILLLLVVIIYLVLGIIYNGGRFTITLDPNFSIDSGIVLYESLNSRSKTTKLYASDIDFMDNISINWIDSNIDNEKDGPHNGDNYIAYTFYIANEGDEVLNYWMEVYIDDVIKNVDNAIRIMIYQNGERTVYAKRNSITGEIETGTEPFYSEEMPVLRERTNFKPEDIDKYTIVIFIEGDDTDCINDLLGGEIKMHMDIREEHIEQ